MLSVHFCPEHGVPERKPRSGHLQVLLMAPESQLHVAGRDCFTILLRDMLDQVGMCHG